MLWRRGRGRSRAGHGGRAAPAEGEARITACLYNRCARTAVAERVAAHSQPSEDGAATPHSHSRVVLALTYTVHGCISPHAPPAAPTVEEEPRVFLRHTHNLLAPRLVKFLHRRRSAQTCCLVGHSSRPGLGLDPMACAVRAL
jgi:hypothetical protein